MVNPKINAQKLVSRNKSLKNEIHEKAHTSFEKAFSKIEESIESKFKSLNGANDNLEITVYLHKEPVEQEVLQKLKNIYSDAGFNIKQVSYEEQDPYTGQPNRGGGFTPVEYETLYKLILSVK